MKLSPLEIYPLYTVSVCTYISTCTLPHHQPYLSIFMKSTGAGFFLSGTGNILNNSILEPNSGGRISQLQCLSGSNMSTVGDWVSPEGRNLATVQNDPFDIIFGDSNNPGQLLIETPANNRPITSNHEGVYTCVIPDENGQSEYLHIGLYLSASKFYLNKQSRYRVQRVYE